MKLRKLKKHAQEMHGWPNTKGFRTKKDGEWEYQAAVYYMDTGKLPKFVSIKCTISTSNWRSK